MPKLRMETSSDPYINSAFNDIELTVNTRISHADNATAQIQTCLSIEAFDKPTETTCQQYVHRSNCPTETNSPTLPWIHPKHGGRRQAVLEHTSVTMNSRQGPANSDNTTIDDRANGGHNCPHLTIATMKDVLQTLKHKHTKNCLNYDDTNDYLKDEDAKNYMTDESADNCFKAEHDNSCFRDEDTKNCSNHEGTKIFLKHEDTKNCSKQGDTKNCSKQGDTKNCSIQEDTKICLKQEDTKICLKQEDTKNCVKREEPRHRMKAEDLEACWTAEDAKGCPQLHKQDILTEIQEQDANDISRLIHPDILQKLQDDEVVRECRILDTVRDIHLSNVQLLEQVSKSEPAVKRILGRHQLTSKEVRDVSIDEDIQAQVNTFLRTNVTGNLLLTRVLRENYSIFHSWLTAHLQVERNAGVSRFKQALQMIDIQRRKKLEMTDFLSDVAKRMQGLLQACNTALPDKLKKGFPDSSLHVSAEASTSRECGYTCDRDPFTPHLDTVKTPTFCNTAYCCETDDQCTHKVCSGVGRFLDSSESGCRTRKHTSNGYLDTKMDHDTSSTHKKFSRQGRHGRKATEINDRQMYTVTTGNCLEEKDTGYPGNDDKTYTRGHSTDGGICDLSGGEATGWRSVIPDSLNGLSSLCERLIADHTACFQLIGLEPRQCLSLTQAVWVTLQYRCQESFRDKPGIDRRLEALQQENKNLLNELNVLKSRLVDKNVEVLSLQNRLERVEALLKDSTYSTLGKFDTRGELVRVNNSETPKKSNKSSHHIKKICADLLGPKPTTSSSNNSASGLYPVLQCNAMTSNERITAGNKTTSRIHQRFAGSEEDSNSKENSIRRLTDKLQKQLHLGINDTGADNISTDAGKTDITKASETAGLQTDNLAQVQPKRGRTSRVAKNNIGEQTSWRHSLNVVQGSVNLNDGTDQEHAGVVMPADTLEPFGQTDRLRVQKIHTTDGQPAVPCSLPSQIPSTDCLANTSQVTATTSTISESQKHQNGYKNDSKDSRGKKNKAQCRFNMCDRDEEEKESSKLKTKCVLHANVVSLVSSMINDSTSLLLRTGQPGKAAVSKCLRCQRLFNWADNHNLACSYHSQPLASSQKYDQAGRIVPVFNQWRCCLQPENSHGCCLGQHI